MIRVADYIIDRLCEVGVQHIFMVTGRGILYLTDAVARNNEIEGISVHHEQSASYAATAYAQYNGKIGACLVSTGCASMNAITGLLCAWQDNAPCVFISGNHILEETTRYTGVPIRTYGQQEADIISVVQPITKYSVMITDPTEIAYEMDKALYMAQSGRKGPVWIDVPVNIQDSRIEPETLIRYFPEDENIKLSEEDIKFVEEELSKAKRPVILIGSGVRSSGAIEELKAFIHQYPIPVTFSASAPDIFGTKNELSIGAVGSMGGTRAGNMTVQNADFLLVLGSSLSSMVTSPEYSKFARCAKIVVVDIDSIEHSKKTINIHRFIHTDIKEFITSLFKDKLKLNIGLWIEKCKHWKSIFPIDEGLSQGEKGIDLYYLTEKLSTALPEDAILCTDAGLEELILPSNIRMGGLQRCIHPYSQGAMGYALPASIGLYYAAKRPVVAVIGDGSIMMNIQELVTIAYHNIPIKIIVVDNNGYSIIRQRQKTFFRNRTIGNDPGDGVGIPDFKKVAECFQLSYICIEKAENLEEQLEQMITSDGPILCQLTGVENQRYLHSSHARTMERKIAHRPLEDQSPFMDRELFLSEMIIEPIDQ